MFIGPRGSLLFYLPQVSLPPIFSDPFLETNKRSDYKNYDRNTSDTNTNIDRQLVFRFEGNSVKSCEWTKRSLRMIVTFAIIITIKKKNKKSEGGT